MPYLDVDDSHIILSETPYEEKNRCQVGMPEATWNKKLQQWAYPKTFHVAIRAWRRWKKFPDMGCSQDFYNYWDAAMASIRVKYHDVKLATELEPIRLSKHAPWLHQLQAYWFSHPRESVMLDMDMGTGKTKVVLDLIMNRGHMQSLVLAPAGVVQNEVWMEQLERHWDPRAGSVSLLNLADGTVKDRTEEADEFLSGPNKFRIVVINYEAMWREPFRDWALNQHWDLGVAEESHRIKSAGGRFSRTLHLLGRRMDYRIAMSGTPMAHSHLDVYGQFRYLDVGIFGSRADSFRETYALWGGFQGREMIAPLNERRLQKRYFFITYFADESVTPLPPVNEYSIKLTLEPSARKLYRQLDKELTATLEDGREVTVDNVLTKILRLQQITSGCLPVENISDDESDVELALVSEVKAKAILDALTDIHPQHRVVVFTQFDYDMQVVAEAAKKLGRRHFEVSSRAHDIKAWRKKKGAVLSIQYQAGSEGTDLTMARHLIFYSQTLSLYLYKQARKRVHRPGQKHRVNMIHLLVRGTRDIQIRRGLLANSDAIDYIKTHDFSEDDNGDDL